MFSGAYRAADFNVKLMGLLNFRNYVFKARCWGRLINRLAYSLISVIFVARLAMKIINGYAQVK